MDLEKLRDQWETIVNAVCTRWPNIRPEDLDQDHLMRSVFISLLVERQNMSAADAEREYQLFIDEIS